MVCQQPLVHQRETIQMVVVSGLEEGDVEVAVVGLVEAAGEALVAVVGVAVGLVAHAETNSPMLGHPLESQSGILPDYRNSRRTSM